MPGVFSNLSQEQTKFSIVIATGVGLITVAGLGYWLKKYLDSIPPKKWRYVGELSDLICYPIKSCGSIRIKSIECTKLGLRDGYLRDRIFMVISTKGEFVTGRQYPKMVLIHPKIENHIMKLCASGMMDIEVNIEELYKKSPIRVTIWNQTIDAIDCGEDVGRWLSRFILSEDFGLRLVFYPGDLPTRNVREKYKIFELSSPEDTGAFHDSTSCMLFNESSLNDLNSRLQEPVSVLNFRANFVVKGPLPYEEDHWKWIKIGDNVIFRNIKPCTRCIFTTVNPDVGKKNADGNPLRKLKEYRLFSKIGDSPCLGISLGCRVPGRVTIGDPVYVEGI